MQPRQDPERMTKLLARRERHGWSWAELSRRSDLPVWKLCWWSRRLAKKRPVRRSKRAFAPVEIVASPREGGSPIELILTSGVRILVRGDFDAEHLRHVIKALEPGC